MNSERCQDLRPAFFCSEAVLIAENEDVENYLNSTRDKYPMDIQFDKVHVSVDQEDDPRTLKFLVAYGREATFIAFRGARDFEDLGRDMEKPLTSSDLHATVSELAVSFLGPDFKLLAELYRSGTRIIFCGHRLGGAVAQMVTSRFWKENKIDTIKSEENPDSLIAISFGAPQIWDSPSVQDFNDDLRLKNRFLNVSNDEDPLRSLLKDGLQGPHSESPTLGIQVSGNCRGLSSEDSDCVPGKSVEPWNKTMFQKCYKSAVEDVLAQAKFPGRNASADQPLPELVVLSPAPQVISASRKASDSGSIITIRGSNLLFLREKVKLDGLHPWDTVVQTDGILRIFSPEKTKSVTDINNSVSKVVIKTAFGGTSYDVSQGNTDGESNEEPLRLLSRIVQTFYMLATPGPFCCLASEEVLADLDGIVQCVPDSIKDDEKSLSTLFRERAKGCSNIGEMNALVQKVTDFLDTSYEIHYKSGNPYLGFRAGFVSGGALGMVLRLVREEADDLPNKIIRANESNIGNSVVAGLSALGANSVAASLRAMKATTTLVASSVLMANSSQARVSVLVAFFLNPNKFVLEKYSDMLQLAIHEASLWNRLDSDPAPHALALSTLKPSEPALSLTNLEFLLQQEVERSGSKFDRLMELVHDSKAKKISLQSPSNLKYATLESKRHLLRRMRIVAQTVNLYKKEVKNIEFLGLVGEEDSGKSTFIKKIIERVGAAEDSGVPQVGMDYHTDTVTPYMLQDQFYLVDFPGSNGTEKYADAWVQFTMLPSSCILLFDFKGDIKKEQVQMYKQIQKDLDSKIAVVFNKVDQLYTPRVEKDYHAKYFEDHRMKSAELLGCDEKNVHYVCLDPDYKERLAKLRTVGVLGFEELAYKLGKWMDEQSVSESHRMFLDCSKLPETNGSSRRDLHEPLFNGSALSDETS